jgi:type I restriction enzyme S subunit
VNDVALLGDVCLITMGQAPSGDSYNDQGDGLPLVAGAGDFAGSIPSVKKYTTAPGKVSREGDIILGIRASIGERVWSDRPYCLGRGVAGLRPSGKLDSNYLWHWLGHSAERLKSKGRGATFLQVNRNDIHEMEVPLPPLDEQRRIAAILDRLDSLRGMRLNVITALDDLVRSLFSEASGAGPSTVMLLPDAYWFQEGPGIRKWQFTDTGVKLLNVGNITVDGRLDLSKTERHVSADEANGRYKHFLVDPGDLVIASSGISFDADGLLRTRGAFVDEVDLPLCMNTSTIRFKAKTGLSHLTYLRSWLNSAEFRSQISRLVTGSAQQNFGPSHLKQMQITLPPVSIQERFAQQVGAIERHRTRCLEMLTQSDQMTASIQSDAFTGSI